MQSRGSCGKGGGGDVPLSWWRGFLGANLDGGFRESSKVNFLFKGIGSFVWEAGLAKIRPVPGWTCICGCLASISF